VNNTRTLFRKGTYGRTLVWAPWSSWLRFWEEEILFCSDIQNHEW